MAPFQEPGVIHLSLGECLQAWCHHRVGKYLDVFHRNAGELRQIGSDPCRGDDDGVGPPIETAHGEELQPALEGAPIGQVPRHGNPHADPYPGGNPGQSACPQGQAVDLVLVTEDGVGACLPQIAKQGWKTGVHMCRTQLDHFHTGRLLLQPWSVVGHMQQIYPYPSFGDGRDQVLQVAIHPAVAGGGGEDGQPFHHRPIASR